MIDSLNYIALTLITSLSQNSNNIFLFLPGFLLIELPLVILVISGVFRWGWHRDENQIVKYPSVNKSIPFRKVRVIPKWQRGGRVSTLNSGLFFAKHDIVINVDGDTSFDNDMTINMVKHFQSSNTLAVYIGRIWWI